MNIKIFACLLLYVSFSYSNEYDFHQFENFVKNSKTYHQEQKIFKHLKDLRFFLVALQNCKKPFDYEQMVDIISKASLTYERIKEIISQERNWLPSKNPDLFGSLRGRVILIFQKICHFIFERLVKDLSHSMLYIKF